MLTKIEVNRGTFVSLEISRHFTMSTVVFLTEKTRNLEMVLPGKCRTVTTLKLTPSHAPLNAINSILILALPLAHTHTQNMAFQKKVTNYTKTVRIEIFSEYRLRGYISVNIWDSRIIFCRSGRIKNVWAEPTDALRMTHLQNWIWYGNKDREMRSWWVCGTSAGLLNGRTSCFVLASRWYRGKNQYIRLQLEREDHDWRLG